MSVSVSNSAYILKTLWPQRRVVNTVYKDHAFLAMIPKNEQFYGENMVIAVRYADTQGRSASFSTAQAAAGNHAGVRFYLTRAADYQVVSLSTEAILASKNDRGALIKNLDTEMQSGMNNIAKSLATALFRGRSGYVGRIGAVAASSITLANINDVSSFEVGMVLVASATKTGSNRSTPATATITAVNRDTGVLGFATNTFSGTNWSASSSGDYLFAAGDNANNSGSGNKVLGLEDWLPGTAPVAGSDSFLQVDRGVDATRLAGLRMDVSGLNPEEGLITVLSRLGRENGRPDHAFCNHLDFRNIEFQLGSKVVYKQMAVGEIGFTGIEVISGSGRGTCTVLADQDCPAGTLYALQMDTWKLNSLEECPMILDLDGNKLSRVYNADLWEARICYFANTSCDAPGYNAVVTMPS